MIRYFYKGVRIGIDTNDLFRTVHSDDSRTIGDKLEANWEKQLAKAKRTGKNPSLLRAVVDTYIWGYMLYGIILFVQGVGLR